MNTMMMFLRKKTSQLIPIPLLLLEAAYTIKKGQTIYIEVKTTKGALDTPYYLSINEKEFLEENENAYLYRVYEFDENSRSGLIKIISSKKFFKEL